MNRSIFQISLVAAMYAASALQTVDATEPPHWHRLEGIWLGGTVTPLERPPSLANKAKFQAEELAKVQRESAELYWAAGHRDGDVGRDNDAYLDAPMILRNGQTSLIVDPPDGQLPLRPKAEQARDFNLNHYDSFESMSQLDRCITREPTALFPAAYNNAYQIVQTGSHIVIVSEMIHDARVIPIETEARARHIDQRVRSHSGDSRAHWEQNTLVVDTTNFDGHGWLATTGYAARLRGVPYSTSLHVIERFTRIDAETIQYEMQIDDPEYFQKPWTISLPLHLDNGYRIFEYACHEGNSAVEAILRGARAQEAAVR
jgi:hypothetical protein